MELQTLDEELKEVKVEVIRSQLRRSIKKVCSGGTDLGLGTLVDTVTTVTEGKEWSRWMQPLLTVLDAGLTRADTIVSQLVTSDSSAAVVGREWFNTVSGLLLRQEQGKGRSRHPMPHRSCSMTSFPSSPVCSPLISPGTWPLSSSLPPSTLHPRFSCPELTRDPPLLYPASGMDARLQRHFLSLPKNPRGHVNTENLLQRVEDELATEWQGANTYPAIRKFYRNCFSNWVGWVESTEQFGRNVGIDSLRGMSIGWEREQEVMNAFRFPAKVLYNDCTQLFSTLQREGSVDSANFLDEVRVMVGEGAHWDEGLVAKVRELYFSLRERNSVGHLVACVLRTAKTRLRPLMQRLPLHELTFCSGFPSAFPSSFVNCESPLDNKPCAGELKQRAQQFAPSSSSPPLPLKPLPSSYNSLPVQVLSLPLRFSSYLASLASKTSVGKYALSSLPRNPL